MTAEFFMDTTAFNAIAASWWRAQGTGHNLSPDALSTYCTVVKDGQQPIAIQYVYPILGSKIAGLGFTCGDPLVSKFKMGKAIRLLFKASEEGIRQLGWSIVYTGFDSPALQKTAAKLGYSAGDSMTEYWRKL
jgi:hypothetical protein